MHACVKECNVVDKKKVAVMPFTSTKDMKLANISHL